ncbi:MAG: cupin domain-containing protein [Victivallaceae bacterium]|nr:cupin domain-containing protein [Victivallaceae bacterium]
MKEEKSKKSSGLNVSEVFKMQDLVTNSEGAVVSRTIVDKKAGTVTLFAFDAGEGLSEHSAPFDAMVTVLEGKVEIRIGGVPKSLQAGESIIMPANVPHGLNATTAFKMMLVMIKA